MKKHSKTSQRHVWSFMVSTSTTYQRQTCSTTSCLGVVGKVHGHFTTLILFASFTHMQCTVLIFPALHGNVENLDFEKAFHHKCHSHAVEQDLRSKRSVWTIDTFSRFWYPTSRVDSESTIKFDQASWNHELWGEAGNLGWWVPFGIPSSPDQNEPIFEPYVKNRPENPNLIQNRAPGPSYADIIKLVVKFKFWKSQVVKFNVCVCVLFTHLLVVKLPIQQSKSTTSCKKNPLRRNNMSELSQLHTIVQKEVAEPQKECLCELPGAWKAWELCEKLRKGIRFSGALRNKKAQQSLFRRGQCTFVPPSPP